MGSVSKYDKKELCTVPVIEATTDDTGAAKTTGLIYAFYTNITPANRQDLGITTISDPSQLPLGVALTPSYPRPAKASRRFSTKSASSFISPSKFKLAKADGWTITRSRKMPPLHLSDDGSSLVRTVYVTLRGIKYAWNIPKVTLEKMGEAASALGIEKATEADIKDLVFGADFPKPGKAKGIITLGTGTAATSANVITFYDPSKDAGSFPQNWQIVSQPILTLI